MSWGFLSSHSLNSCYFACVSEVYMLINLCLIFFFILFYFLNFIYLFIFIIIIIFFLLYNIVLVLPYISMHPPQVYTCSQSWTPLPPPSPYHPSGSSQCTSPKHPVSCIEPGLVIHFLYDIIYVSMPFSQIISPLQSPKDCSIHLCLFCCLADFLLLFCHLL